MLPHKASRLATNPAVIVINILVLKTYSCIEKLVLVKEVFLGETVCFLVIRHLSMEVGRAASEIKSTQRHDMHSARGGAHAMANTSDLDPQSALYRNR